MFRSSQYTSFIPQKEMNNSFFVVVCFLVFKDPLLINKAVEKGHCYLTKWL